MYLRNEKKYLNFLFILGLMPFFAVSMVSNAGPFEDLEKELDELNASGKGYQGLLDDLDAVGDESAQTLKPIVLSSGDDSGGFGVSVSDNENKNTLKKFNSGAIKVISPVPGIYSFTCKNGTRGTINSSSLFKKGSASQAISHFENYVTGSINTACGDTSAQAAESTNAVNWVLGNVRSWVMEKHQACLKKYPSNQSRCDGIKKRIPGLGVRG